MIRLSALSRGILFALAFLPFAVHAQQAPDVIARAVQHRAGLYDPNIPAPRSVLGHDVGARHTEPHQVVEYFRAVAGASERVILREHAQSYEGRPLVHAIVTSPSNLARLDRIRVANAELSDRPASVTDAALEAMPGVVLMSYSVHGNEASGTESALLLLYHLAASQDTEVNRILDSLVVIVDPMLNPDGRGRFTTWANRNRGRAPVSDPQDREHGEAWPGGRGNHYWFDLNRDYVPVQHPETRGRLSVFHDWRPQVVTDFHEMGSDRTYFFQPGIPSRTNPNTPALNQELTADIARYHAEGLDGLRALYYTEETFDDFYYGKWSTYPDINGAVGILFEQASSRALLRETRSGDLHYSTTVRNQFATSLATLRAVLHHRARLLRYQRDFYAEAFREGERRPGGFFVGSRGDRSRGEGFAELLDRHQIEVYRLAREAHVDGVTLHPDDSYFVPWRQRQSRLLETLFERRTQFEDSVFYDVSAWTLPLAFDLAVVETTRAPGDLVGERWAPTASTTHPVVPDAVAYCLSWNDFYAARVLDQLQRLGAGTRVATHAFSAITPEGEMEFAPGTIIVTRAQLSADSLHTALMRAIAGEQVIVYPVTSGLTPDGPDLGSPGNEVLTRRHIALVIGDGTSVYAAGEVWHLLSERLELPVTLLDAGTIGRADLSRYTTIVMAGGRYSDISADALVQWVSGGGHLIATSDASLWAIAAGLIDSDSLSVDLDSVLVGVPYADRSKARGAHYVGGVILNLDVDATHPVAFGLNATLPIFREGRTFVSQPGSGEIVVARYSDPPLLSGYLPDSAAKLIPDAVSVISASRGRGRIVVFAENPVFRGFWLGSSRMFINAIFFGEAL